MCFTGYLSSCIYCVDSLASLIIQISPTATSLTGLDVDSIWNFLQPGTVKSVCSEILIFIQNHECELHSGSKS